MLSISGSASAPPVIRTMASDDAQSHVRAVPLPGTAGVALTDLSPMRLEQLQHAWRSRRRLSEPTIGSLNSATARKEQVQRHMVRDHLGGGEATTGLTDVTGKELESMMTVWGAKRTEAPIAEEVTR